MKATSLKHSGITIKHDKFFKWDSDEEENEKIFEAESKLNEEVPKEENNKWSQDLSDALPGFDG